MILIVAGSLIVKASAQNASQVELSKPDTSAYPDIALQFRAYDANGNFARDLDVTSVHVLENNQLISPDRLDLLQTGVHVIAAINEGPTLGNRYAQVSRIDKVKEALINWAQSQSTATLNQFSLISNSGTLISGSINPGDWASALRNYAPEMRQSKPSLSSLSAAVSAAVEEANQTQKTPVVFYFTPLPDKADLQTLTGIFDQARLANVRLFIWLAGPPEYETDEMTAVLQSAANASGGDFMLFTGPESLPSLNPYFNPLAYSYRLVYHSQIQTSGDYSVSLRVDQGQSVSESNPVSMNLNVLPPEPIFLSPPATVERSWTVTEKRKDSVLTPDTVQLQILIEFPDHLIRDFVYSRLFIDNQMVDEHTSAPFETFTWDISQITVSGTHSMRVTIEDEAGFIVQTLELPVEVVVQPKPQTWFEKILSAFTLQTIILFGIIAISGVLLLILAVRALGVNRKVRVATSHHKSDPVTQPVVIENEIIHPKRYSDKPGQWPRILGLEMAPARLTLVSAQDAQNSFPAEIALGDHVTTFGSDPAKSKILLSSSVISPLHARIERDESGQFKIFDEGSGSGTWLNYAPVSHFGARLDHGDQVQFGTLAYRFEIYNSTPRKIVVETFKVDE